MVGRPVEGDTYASEISCSQRAGLRSVECGLRCRDGRIRSHINLRFVFAKIGQVAQALPSPPLTRWLHRIASFARDTVALTPGHSETAGIWQWAATWSDNLQSSLLLAQSKDRDSIALVNHPAQTGLTQSAGSSSTPARASASATA